MGQEAQGWWWQQAGVKKGPTEPPHGPGAFAPASSTRKAEREANYKVRERYRSKSRVLPTQVCSGIRP